MLHSHPQWYQNTVDNDLFSWGDALVSTISGKIYLTTPHGEVYALEGKDGKKMIVPGYIRDEMVRVKNIAWKYGIRPDQVLSLWGTLFSDDFLNWYNEAGRGYNFGNYNVKTYDTRR
ncbi:MAG: hypothetical protein E7330_03595 [Clostridiales bacterium]|nr:hypothetical protein [Clostridiales bacterium]